jgi:hypothetical protein
MKIIDTFLSICGLINAIFSTLLVIDPSWDEILGCWKEDKTLMSVWREHKMSAMLNAHILEHHMSCKMRELGCLGDKDDSFVELLHQDGRKMSGV